MSQPESKLSRRIMAELNSDPGVFCFKIHGGPHMLAGLPDIIGVAYGRFFAFETKMPEKRSNTSVIQRFIMAKLSKAGGYVAVVCSVDEARACLSECIDRKLPKRKDR